MASKNDKKNNKNSERNQNRYEKSMVPEQQVQNRYHQELSRYQKQIEKLAGMPGGPRAA